MAMQIINGVHVFTNVGNVHLYTARDDGTTGYEMEDGTFKNIGVVTHREAMEIARADYKATYGYDMVVVGDHSYKTHSKEGRYHKEKMRKEKNG